MVRVLSGGGGGVIMKGLGHVEEVLGVMITVTVGMAQVLKFALASQHFTPYSRTSIWVNNIDTRSELV